MLIHMMKTLFRKEDWDGMIIRIAKVMGKTIKIANIRPVIFKKDSTSVFSCSVKWLQMSFASRD